jgi:hypothetical protein
MLCGDGHAKEQQGATYDGDEVVKEVKRNDGYVTFESHLKCVAVCMYTCGVTTSWW